MYTVVILAIGNELLIGETLDTNTNWLCQNLTALGLQVAATLTLPDDLGIIASTVEQLLSQKIFSFPINLLISTGGLGPTSDDLTLEAIAKSLDLSLELNQIAYQWIVEKYQALAEKNFVDSAEINDARSKMAFLPLTSIPIKNPEGVAPAIKITAKNTTVICLPGVPQEMKAFMLGPVQALLSELYETGIFAEKELFALCGDESLLAPILSQVAKLYPQVYIKSKAKGFGKDLRFQIKLHIRGKDSSINSLLSAAENSLCQALNSNGIQIIA
ncbi:MAG: competence/damage-inducible protein A [Blastocatellia bacterium]|nr:competence/damage-inducible protein A [Blastocatellia bacterium]MBN8723927.1 competence/damage-inducible protein A [Acidobacteriota bacterium]